MFRKPITWIAFVVLAAICAVYSYTTFPRVFPLVNLDLKMNRETALESARILAEENGWGPEEFRQAAAFEGDPEVRSFVELEGGGRDAYIELIAGDRFSPYKWRVRHFKPGETNETEIRFTPAGEKYGFRETLSEETPGASLSAEEARPIAEAAATGSWGLNLSDYDLVEERQEVHPGGRTDHTFVYERPEGIGEGRYRLRLVVGGDRLTELTHLVKVPEAFERRYQEMRSANDAIAIASTVVMFVLFIGGGIVGLFFLMRERWILWRKPLLWATIVAAGMALLTMNQWPLAWMGYDTAVSTTNYTLQRISTLVGAFFGLGLLYVLSFMAAECLTRRAFPHHIQLWKAWTTKVAGSTGLLGRTLAGYLLVPVDLTFLVLFYLVAFDKLGWWSPSEALLDPNVLATPFPWLASIAVSFQAGFWEESLFRAVPIAGAALIGRRLGGRRYWILGAVILQALVFGAGHANYPGQPSYARVVELFLPAAFWGVVYIAYGLLPVIVLHVTFDVVLISLPLWVSSSAGLWDDRIIVVLLTLIPLGVVLAARWKRGRWGQVEEDSLNRAWTPPPPAPEPVPAAAPAQRQAGVAGRTQKVLWGLGAAGALAWIVLYQPPTDAPPITTSRAEAIAAADAAIAERGLTPPGAARTLARVQAQMGDTHRFVWKEAGEEAYREVLANYLPAPRWQVRYATFEGDVAARAEEFQVWVDGAGNVTRIQHRLPEAAEGATLDEEEARILARETVREKYGLDPDTLKEVKASPSKEENRTDWKFEFAEPGVLPIEEGEARTAVDIAGDEVADTGRFIHLPEGWERDERNRRTLTTGVQISCFVASLLIFMAGAVVALIRWSRKQFVVRTFLMFLVLLSVVRTILFLVSWPTATAQFQTAVAFNLQAAIILVFGLLIALVTSGTVGLNLGLVDRLRPTPPGSQGFGAVLSGVALGTLVAGGVVAIGTFGPQEAPRWASYAAADSAIPWVSAGLGQLSGFVTVAALLLLIFVAVDHWSHGWTRHQSLVALLFIPAGLILSGMSSVDTLVSWILTGVLTAVALGVAYVWILRHDLSLIPMATGSFMVLNALAGGLADAYPGARAGSVVTVLLVLPVAILWHRLLAEPEPGVEPGVGS